MEPVEEYARDSSGALQLQVGHEVVFALCDEAADAIHKALEQRCQQIADTLSSHSRQEPSASIDGLTLVVEIRVAARSPGSQQ